MKKLGILLIFVIAISAYLWLDKTIACDEGFSQALAELESGKHPEAEVTKVLFSNRRPGAREWSKAGELADPSLASDLIKKIRKAIFEGNDRNLNTRALGSTMLARESDKAIRLDVYNVRGRFTSITLTPWDTKDGRHIFLVWIGCDQPFTFTEDKIDLRELVKPYLGRTVK